MENREPRIGIRRMVDDDRAYITHTWLHTHRHFGDWHVRMDREVYMRCHRLVVHRLIEAHATLVAYDPEDPRVILGFLCGDNYASAPVVHFIYVRDRLRRFGVAKALMLELGWVTSAPIIATHWTSAVKSLQQQRPIMFNPYYAFQDYSGVLSNGKTTRE